MTDIRTIDLDEPADNRVEVRLQFDSCVMSLWLPAEIGAMGRALAALQAAGFVAAIASAPDGPLALEGARDERVRRGD